MDEKDKRIKELEEEVKKLKKQKEQIEEEFEDTKKKFEEYKAQYHSQFNPHSFVKEDVKHLAKISGQKKGHKGYTRRIPERIDFVQEWNPKNCPTCDAELSETQEVRHRYVTDIKLKFEVVNTQHNIYRKYCSKCKKLVEQSVPNVLPHARFGLNLMLFIMYLRLGLSLPGNKVCELLNTMYNITISEGEIVVVLRQLVKAFGPYYNYLEKIIKLARVKHTDSTGWRINGKNYFAWVFIAAGKVIYKIRKRNNSKVALQLFGTKQQGKTLVVDRHSAFRTLAEKAGYLLQLCWAHILRDSKDLAKDFGREGKYTHEKLKEIFALAKGLNHKGTPEHVDQLKAEILLLTKRHYKHTTIRKFVSNLYHRDVENLFRFVTDHEVDPTNNISERELRKLVIIRKISNGSRSTRGANATAMLLSIIETLRINNKNILKELQKIQNITSTQ